MERKAAFKEESKQLLGEFRLFERLGRLEKLHQRFGASRKCNHILFDRYGYWGNPGETCGYHSWKELKVLGRKVELALDRENLLVNRNDKEESDAFSLSRMKVVQSTGKMLEGNEFVKNVQTLPVLDEYVYNHVQKEGGDAPREEKAVYDGNLVMGKLLWGREHSETSETVLEKEHNRTFGKYNYIFCSLPLFKPARIRRGSDEQILFILSGSLSVFDVKAKEQLAGVDTRGSVRFLILLNGRLGAEYPSDDGVEPLMELRG